ncbi:MAG: hypothetical protein ACRDHS_01320 [Actinomycetota bacterium]
MPVSKPSRRRRASRSRASPVPQKRSAAPWRKRLGWPLVAIGAVLFLLGNIGARTGIVFLPFDPHHVFEQFGGAAIAVIGLIWATGR